MRKTVVILLSIISLVFAVETVARRQRTTRGKVSGRNVAEPAKAAVDSIIIPDSSEVLLYGYDKPLRSRQETVFVANNTLHDITALIFTTRYIDTKGRQFHQQSRRVRADIPSVHPQNRLPVMGCPAIVLLRRIATLACIRHAV